MQELLTLLEKGKSPYHAVAQEAMRLREAGFEELVHGKEWKIEAGGRYFVRPYASMLFTLVIPQGISCDTRMRIAVAHTDFPCFKIKPKADMTNKGYMQLNIEPYGGMLKNTWFDRPLGIYGKVILESEDAFTPEVCMWQSEKPVAVIPSLAPHLDRGNGEKKEYDMQQELIPVIGMLEEQLSKEDFLMKYLANGLGVARESILDYDLYITNMDSPAYVGMQDEFICSPRIDNLASVSAIVEAMIQSKDSKKLLIGGMFDHEEIGSRSKQGADSTLLFNIVKKAAAALGIEDGQLQDMLSNGFLLSVDGAQATHPNYSNKSDPTNDVIPGKGIVIKTSASQRYLSDSESTAVIESLCRRHNIPCQRQVNRFGMPGGQTLGPIAISYLPMHGADIGIPMLAMHSARELASPQDYQTLRTFLTTYFV